MLAVYAGRDVGMAMGAGRRAEGTQEGQQPGIHPPGLRHERELRSASSIHPSTRPCGNLPGHLDRVELDLKVTEEGEDHFVCQRFHARGPCLS
jgi:hypothetical protein